jgi:hypothetical protein
MNYIISSLFTTCIDPIRNIKWSPSSDIMDNWYNSGKNILNNNSQLLVFYDQLESSFKNKYDSKYITFIKVEDCNLFSPHDYRWIIYYNFLRNNVDVVDNIFFTDISDVLIKQNPFQYVEKDTLYIGDEYEYSWENWWALPKIEYYIKNIKNFNGIYEKNKLYPFLNAGILGGEKGIVLKFLEKMKNYIESTLDKPYETTDMIIFNYILHKYFKHNIKHGEPINSKFKLNEIHRNDVWFIHK